MDLTTLGLKKPLVTEAYDLQIVNDNADKVNELITADRAQINDLDTLKVTPHLADLITDADGAHGLKVESGTFTATVTGGTVAGNITTTFATGKYVKINKKVFIAIQIRITAIADSTGSLVIGGLPFVPNDNYAVAIDRYRGINLAAGYNQLSGYTNASNQILLNESGSGKTTNVVVGITDLVPTTDIFLSCTYLTN